MHDRPVDRPTDSSRPLNVPIARPTPRPTARAPGRLVKRHHTSADIRTNSAHTLCSARPSGRYRVPKLHNDMSRARRSCMHTRAAKRVSRRPCVEHARPQPLDLPISRPTPRPTARAPGRPHDRPGSRLTPRRAAPPMRLPPPAGRAASRSRKDDAPWTLRRLTGCPHAPTHTCRGCPRARGFDTRTRFLRKASVSRPFGRPSARPTDPSSPVDRSLAWPPGRPLDRPIDRPPSCSVPTRVVVSVTTRVAVDGEEKCRSSSDVLRPWPAAGNRECRHWWWWCACETRSVPPFPTRHCHTGPKYVDIGGGVFFAGLILVCVVSSRFDVSVAWRRCSLPLPDFVPTGPRCAIKLWIVGAVCKLALAT